MPVPGVGLVGHGHAPSPEDEPLDRRTGGPERQGLGQPGESVRGVGRAWPRPEPG
jgi:hypothetical protein